MALKAAREIAEKGGLRGRAKSESETAMADSLITNYVAGLRQAVS